MLLILRGIGCRVLLRAGVKAKEVRWVSAYIRYQTCNKHMRMEWDSAIGMAGYEYGLPGCQAVCVHRTTHIIRSQPSYDRE